MKRTFAILLVVVLCFASVGFAQNVYQSVPRSTNTAYTTDPGSTFVNSATHSSAVITTSDIDSMQFGIYAKDSVNISAIYFVRLATETATWGDTSSTLGTVACVDPTGKFQWFTNLMQVTTGLSGYGKFVIVFNSSGNPHVSIGTKYYLYVKKFNHLIKQSYQ
jgi:hypothetical protein